MRVFAALRRHLRGAWDEGFANGRARARARAEAPTLIGDVETYLAAEPKGLEPVPDWPNLRRAIVLIEAQMRGDLKAIGEADRMGAYVRDTFDAMGISIRHEPSLYVILTTASLMVEISSNGLEKGIVDPETVAAVAQIAQSLAAVLIPYLPPEAKT